MRNDGERRTLFAGAVALAAADRTLLLRAGLAWFCFPARPHQSPTEPAIDPSRPRRRTEKPVLLTAHCRLGMRLAVGILELLGSRQMALHLSHVPEMENLRNASSRVSRVPALRPGVFRYVRDCGVGARPQGSKEDRE